LNVTAERASDGSLLLLAGRETSLPDWDAFQVGRRTSAKRKRCAGGKPISHHLEEDEQKETQLLQYAPSSVFDV
jgi:hypothetical protein